MLGGMSALTADGRLLLTADPVDLTQALCDVPSESGDERRLADLIEEALAPYDHLEVIRHDNTVVARTNLGRPTRVAIAGHLDTVPINANLPTRRVVVDAAAAAADVPGTRPGEYLWGRGTVDMKAGVAVQLHLAATLREPVVDVTWMWYENEERSAELNGLRRLAEARPDLFDADFAILGEPTGGIVEGGCNGSLRVNVTARGTRAHSARAWAGENAIHAATPILERLAAYEPRTARVEGLDYIEGLNAVGISGGIAGNVIPNSCTVHINYRFAPDTSVDEALARLHEWFDGFEIELLDASAPGRPGLDAPYAQDFIRAVGGAPKPKYGWTDVARFSALGIPAVNYGPGDAQKAHADDERVRIDEISLVTEGLRAWLTGAPADTARTTDPAPTGADA